MSKWLMNKWLLISTLLLLQIPAFADNAAVEASGVNPIDKKTEFINNHQIAFGQIKIGNETKKFIAVIGSVGAKKIVVYEVNPTTNTLEESTVFKEKLYSPFYITFDPSGMYLYAVSGTRNFINQYKFDSASKKFIPNTSENLQTACSDNSRFNFDYFRSIQFFGSDHKAYVTCEDLRGDYYVLGYRFDAKTGLLMNPDTSLWTENRQNAQPGDGIVEKSMLKLGDPMAVLIDPSGKYLYFVDKRHVWHLYQLASNGRFEATSYSFNTGELLNTGSMTFDPAGKNVYVIARDRGGDSVVIQYKFDPASGKLEKADVITMHNKHAHEFGEIRTQASHVQFTPDGRYAYVLDNRHNVIYQYRADPVTGNLSPLNPAVFIACSNIRSLVFDHDPNSRFAYAAAANHASLKPHSEKLCKHRVKDPFNLHIDPLVVDPVTGQLANFAPRS